MTTAAAAEATQGQVAAAEAGVMGAEAETAERPVPVASVIS